jgi:hypothetical protein
VRDTAGEIRARLGVAPEGSAVVEVGPTLTNLGTGSAQMFSTRDGRTFLRVNEAGGQTLWQAP